jgi:hypothetical protein
MKNKKRVVAVVITSVAITGSASALANASGAKTKSVSRTTVTQIHMKSGLRGPMGGGFQNSNKVAVITATLGIDATTLHTRLAAGESLATIAGAKKDALIAALVADETKKIDAAVTAGKLTAAQATILKAGLTAHVTAEVNAVGHMGGMKGGHGRGHHGGGMGLPNGSSKGIPSTTTTTAN